MNNGFWIAKTGSQRANTAKRKINRLLIMSDIWSIKKRRATETAALHLIIYITFRVVRLLSDR